MRTDNRFGMSNYRIAEDSMCSYFSTKITIKSVLCIVYMIMMKNANHDEICAFTRREILSESC